MTEDIYVLLARHLGALGMGYPAGEGLEEILRENYGPAEAEVALALPTRVSPFQPVSVETIAGQVNLPQAELVAILERLVTGGLLFVGKTEAGERGYALQQFGWGFPQSWFWGGKETPHAKKMAGLVRKYQNREVTQQGYGGSETKAYRFVPVGETSLVHHHDGVEAVYPFHMMKELIEQAEVIAVAHCPCRMVAHLRGKGCEHPVEVCLKYDELAQYVIDTGRGREITKAEALEITKASEELGLVHLVDNALEGVKHSCNCCSCACWSVNSIKRRKIPRDALMATYFMRETERQNCTACGDCVAVCPVDALTMGDDIPLVDEEWCIGCGVCVNQCANDAARLRPRLDRIDKVPHDFAEQQTRILQEKGLSQVVV